LNRFVGIEEEIFLEFWLERDEEPIESMFCISVGDDRGPIYFGSSSCYDVVYDARFHYE
jgi:hypothetical protein